MTCKWMSGATQKIGKRHVFHCKKDQLGAEPQNHGLCPCRHTQLGAMHLGVGLSNLGHPPLSTNVITKTCLPGCPVPMPNLAAWFHLVTILARSTQRAVLVKLRTYHFLTSWRLPHVCHLWCESCVHFSLHNFLSFENCPINELLSFTCRKVYLWVTQRKNVPFSAYKLVRGKWSMTHHAHGNTTYNNTRRFWIPYVHPWTSSTAWHERPCGRSNGWLDGDNNTVRL